MKLLIVEDNREQLNEIKDYLVKQQYVVESCPNFADAKAKLAGPKQICQSLELQTTYAFNNGYHNSIITP